MGSSNRPTAALYSWKVTLRPTRSRTVGKSVGESAQISKVSRSRAVSTAPQVENEQVGFLLDSSPAASSVNRGLHRAAAVERQLPDDAVGPQVEAARPDRIGDEDIECARSGSRGIAMLLAKALMTVPGLRPLWARESGPAASEKRFQPSASQPARNFWRVTRGDRQGEGQG